MPYTKSVSSIYWYLIIFFARYKISLNKTEIWFSTSLSVLIPPSHPIHLLNITRFHLSTKIKSNFCCKKLSDWEWHLPVKKIHDTRKFHCVSCIIYSGKVNGENVSEIFPSSRRKKFILRFFLATFLQQPDVGIPRWVIRANLALNYGENCSHFLYHECWWERSEAEKL